MDTETERYVNARMETVKAQNDARFSEVLAELRKIPSTGTLAWMFAGAVISVIGIIIGALAFGGDRFDGGVQITGVAVEQAVEARNIAKENAEKINGVNDKLDTLIGIMQEKISE